MSLRTKSFIKNFIDQFITQNGQGQIGGNTINVALTDIIDSFSRITIVQSDSDLSPIQDKYLGMLVFVQGTGRIRSWNGTNFDTVTINGLSQTQIEALLSAKVDKVDGKGLSEQDFSTVLRDKLNGIATNATQNQSDSHLLNRSNHTGVQPISTISGLPDQLLLSFLYRREVKIITQNLYEINSDEDAILVVDASSNAVNLILPTSDTQYGFVVKRIDSSGNDVKIFPNDYNESYSDSASQTTIEGSLEESLATQYSTLNLFCVPEENLWVKI